MAITHISASGRHVLDGMGYVFLFLYHLKNDLCTPTYSLWALIDTRKFKVMGVENIQDGYQQGSQKVLVRQVIRNWRPYFFFFN